jgi:hypothetical protein
MTNCPHCGKSLEAETRPWQWTVEVENRVWFNDFWALYPRHVGKAAALKAWKKAATSEAVKDEIMAALRVQLPQFQRHLDRMEPKFIPHASTWLNGRRWEDEQAGIAKMAPKRVIACELCGDTGTIAKLKQHEDTMALLPCSCARGALPGLTTGIYRVSTGERLGDVPISA